MDAELFAMRSRRRTRAPAGEVITGVYDAASVGITLIDTGKLDRLRAQVEALREALLDLFYASGDVSVSGQKDSVNAFLEARKQALASAGSGKK